MLFPTEWESQKNPWFQTTNQLLLLYLPSGKRLQFAIENCPNRKFLDLPNLKNAGPFHTMWARRPPPVISWFISPSTYSYKYDKP